MERYQFKNEWNKISADKTAELNLHGVSALDYDDPEYAYVARLTDPDVISCPRCQSVNIGNRANESSYYDDLLVSNSQIITIPAKGNYRTITWQYIFKKYCCRDKLNYCPDFEKPIEFAAYSKHTTYRAENIVAQLYMTHRMQDIHDMLGQKFGIERISEIVSRWAERADMIYKNLNKKPEILVLTIRTIARKKAVVVTAIEDLKKPEYYYLDCIELKSALLRDKLKSLTNPKKVKLVWIEENTILQETVHQLFPYATISMDRVSLIRSISNMFDSEALDIEAKIPKKIITAMHEPQDTLDPLIVTHVEEQLEETPSLREMYEFLQMFIDFTERHAWIGETLDEMEKSSTGFDNHFVFVVDSVLRQYKRELHNGLKNRLPDSFYPDCDNMMKKVSKTYGASFDAVRCKALYADVREVAHEYFNEDSETVPIQYSGYTESLITANKAGPFGSIQFTSPQIAQRHAGIPYPILAARLDLLDNFMHQSDE